MDNQNIQTNFAEQVRPDFRVRTFYEAAKKYIYFLESWVIDNRSAPEAIRLLMSLYQKAEMLPEGINITKVDPQHSDRYPWAKDQIWIECQSKYHGIFNPFSGEAPEELNLSVDLGDIADDLEIGVFLYESGVWAQAAGCWKEGWKRHWGYHAVAAIRVLHWMKDMERLPEPELHWLKDTEPEPEMDEGETE